MQGLDSSAAHQLTVVGFEAQQGRTRRSKAAFIGRAPAFLRAVRLANAVADHDTTVLLTGETGSGKGVMAKHIHERSQRRSRPFVELNCAGLQRELTESELFGHERGSFTGANARKIGLLEVADGGTIFLDEIGEMDLSVQAKLLTVLERRRFRRVGGTQEIEVDVRIITATHTDLWAAVTRGDFREDLYYRLDVFAVELPPLRDRPEDIVPLANNFLRTLTGPGDAPRMLAPDAERRLRDNAWPGNIRELRNAIERACILCPAGAHVTVDHLPRARAATTAPTSPAAPTPTTMRDAERTLLADALERHGFNIKATARALEISRGTLYRKIRKYEIDVPARA